MNRAPLVSMAVLGLLAWAEVARAQGGGSAEAEELFKQGRAALDTHDYEAACLKLDQSLQLERAVGTLISLAECEQATNRLAGARQHWQEAADLAEAKNDPLHRQTLARQKFAELDRRVPRLLVHLASGAPTDTVWQRDDVALGKGSFDAALPVDPGAHLLTIRAPGHADGTYPVDLREGERKTLEVAPGPELAPTAETSAPPAMPPPPAPAVLPAPIASAAPSAPPPPSPSGSAQRTAGYVVGGVGVVGLALGTYFGINAFTEWSKAKTDCGPAGCAAGSTARNAAESDQSSASNAGTASTIAFVAGGAALAAGVVLWMTAPRAPRTEAGATGATLTWLPLADAHGGGLSVRGTW